MKIGKIIKILALTEDVSMTELAGRLNISRQALYQRLEGKMMFDTAKECFNVLGYDLYYGKDNEVRKIK